MRHSRDPNHHGKTIMSNGKGIAAEAVSIVKIAEESYAYRSPANYSAIKDDCAASGPARDSPRVETDATRATSGTASDRNGPPINETSWEKRSPGSLPN